MFPLYLATALIFLILDTAVLKLLLRPVFARAMGPTMRDGPRVLPAAIFYLGYAAGLVWLISLPAMMDGLPVQAALRGAVLGAVAYGTSEFRAMSMLRPWRWSLVVIGSLWGAFATGLAAWAGVLLVLRFP
ncbi:DUF2177 family protein [Palleronia abyssalis]|uniref:DUF2177 domain-containing protein n=1 Tax=Palleronia abyssalis TaxID=1501240 RepID=A0A2R8BYQ8_9RHOB|nr:DUF2177 family protein [Palleronia abyssalis]SPJ25315.1 hypothetical protein PAA8504_03166 [Palleronia abyssalis]